MPEEDGMSIEGSSLNHTECGWVKVSNVPVVLLLVFLLVPLVLLLGLSGAIGRAASAVLG